jgi:aromatic-amino-acid transaminase
MSTSLLASVPMAPRDPILGVTEAYNADKNPNKVNLGVGIYYDDNGKVPLLECVKRAERQMMENLMPRAYLPIDGIAAYDKAVQQLVFGADHPAVLENRIITVQALGGTGGLKIGGDLLKRLVPNAQVWISDPSWENHRAIFENAGFVVNSYPYYDSASKGLGFDAMLKSLQAMPEGAIVVLHACCHNPTGADLNADQWDKVRETVMTRGLIPFLDIAYQGFADGIEADAIIVRTFAKATNPVFVSNSFSKSFSLYGERVGALSVVTASADEAARTLSQLKRIVRTNYSNPPTHGGQVVATVLNNPELRKLWEDELGQMRLRIRGMREKLTSLLEDKLPNADYGFVIRQRGMFSYSGLSKEQVTKLRENYSIYAIDSGRICVAALNTRNIENVANAIAAIV